MSNTHDNAEPTAPKRLGLLAQFAGPDELMAAAEKITDDGYKRVEAYTPFPVIGIDQALKAKGTILPWIVVTLGLTGCLTALVMQIYTNGVEGPWWLSGYHFMISAKPALNGAYVPTLPAFIPVTFELIVLLSAFGAFFGMLILNQLPKLSNPLFRSERFAEVTNDGFFLFVEVDDPKYAETETEAYLTSIGATAVEGVDEPTTGHAVPGMLYLIGPAFACLTLLWPLYVWTTSQTTSTVPRISFFKDMEAQAKFKAQRTSGLFEDGRSARKPIDGTVARGRDLSDLQLYEGVNSEPSIASAFGGETRLASFDGGRAPARLVADEEAPEEETAAPAEEVEKDWVTELPAALTLDADFMERGQQRYNIHCAVCHGLAGNGDGLVSQRAQKVSGATWQLPTNLHVEAVTTQPVGRIFDTISHGRRKMPGYNELITPKDRWAIVFYMQALQRSQNASLEDVPEEMRDAISRN